MSDASVQRADVPEVELVAQATLAELELPDGFRRVVILRKCVFTAQDGKQYTYGPGTRVMPIEHAEHWFVRHHSDVAPEVELKPGMAGYVDAQRVEAQTAAPAGRRGRR